MSVGKADKIKTRSCDPPSSGAIAQLGERIVRNDEVVGSIPTSSTKFWLKVFNSFNRAALGLYKFCTTEQTQESQHLA